MKILVVDDEADVQILFQQRFRKEIRSGELNLFFATNGFDALAVLDKNRQDIRLVLSDINMPGMSGLDLLKNIKTPGALPTPGVIMISAYGDEDNRRRCKDLGADNLLPKPLDFNALKVLIAEQRPGSA
jgi:two-component system, chemotaxis family, chemotaxis protein CheY